MAAFQFTRGAGGQFTGSVGGVQMPPAMVALYQRLGAAAGGKLSFNGRTGTGYGTPGGDARVKLLQQALNDAGFTDGRGKPLAVDGKLGPLTTQAVKSAQAKLGLPQDGVVTPKLLAQIGGLPKAPAKPAGKAPNKPTARARFKAAASKPSAPKASAPSAPSKTPSYQAGAVKFQ